MSCPITLYGNRESGHSYKVRLALMVAQLPHDYVAIDIFKPHAERPEPFRSLAKFGEVPVLVHAGQAYVQSDAILCWVAEHTCSLGAESPDRMARVREWLFWEANRVGLSLPHIRFARQFSNEGYEPATLEWLKRRYLLDIARLDAELSVQPGFIVGDSPTVADFALCGYLFWADQALLPVQPHVKAWLERISHLPGWQAPYDLLS